MRVLPALRGLTIAVVLSLTGLTAPAHAQPAHAQPSYAEPEAWLPSGAGLDVAKELVELAAAQRAGSDLLRRARVAVDGTGRAAGSRADAPTLTLADVFAAYPRLSEDQQEIADALLARPSDRSRDSYGDGYRVPEAYPSCGPNVCVHHVGLDSGDADAPPDRAWVRRVRRVMEDVWSHHVDQMGYRAPAPDDGRGGDDRFDVYLADIGEQGYYGYCTPEQARPGQPRRSSGYCVLDNDFAEFDGPALRNLKVTAAHEFFHAIQFDYDVGEDRWFMEATAVWMEGQYAPRARDNEQFLPAGQLGRPGKPLDLFETSGLAHYGNWLFFQRLSDTFGRDAVRRLWERAAAGRGDADEYSTQALKRYLRAQGSSLRAFYSVYAGGNLTPRRAYGAGTRYAATAPARRMDLRAGQKGRYRTRLPHLSSRTLEVRPAPVRGKRGTRPRVLRIDVRVPEGTGRAGARVLVHLRDGRVKSRAVRLGDGQDRVQVPFGAARVERVTVTLVNASARYDCWAGEAYACSGVPRDDGQVLTARVHAVR